MKRLFPCLCALAMLSLATSAGAMPERPKDPKPPIARPMAKDSNTAPEAKSTTSSKGSKAGEKSKTSKTGGKSKGSKTKSAERPKSPTDDAKRKLSNASRAL